MPASAPWAPPWAQVSLPDRHWVARRAWPLAPDHVLVEYRDGTGVLGAQWFADPDRLRSEQERVPGARAVPAAGVLLHDGAVDRRLVCLPALVAAPGVRLLAHRPGRRALVRRGPPGAVCYGKVLRAGRAAALREAHTWLRQAAPLADGLRLVVPPVQPPDPADPDRVDLAGLPGRSLLAWTAAAGDAAGAGSVWGTVAGAVAALHATAPPGHLPRHPAAAERAVTERWWQAATALGLLPARDLSGLLAPLVSEPPGPATLLHRDLHDKQVLVAPPGRDRPQVGLVDLDTLAVGEQALDVANLLVHLELRVAQGALGVVAARRAGAAFLAASRAAGLPAATTARLPAYATAARLRLAAVYALRPGTARVVAALLRAAEHGRPPPWLP